MMKIYIFADMEGVSGINCSDFVLESGSRYQLGCEYFEMDVNACVEGCVKDGASEIVVVDGHCTSRNLCWKNLHPAAELIRKGHHSQRLVDIEGSDGLILLGYHARAGALEALLEHTYSSADIQNAWVNERLVGEFECDAMIAAEYGVPTIMVSGDDKVCAEAKEFIPDVVTCQVKKSYSTQGARLLPMEKAHTLITEKTMEAIGNIRCIMPPRVSYPVTFRVEMMERINPKLTATRRLDARTVEFDSESSFEQAFLACFG